MTTGVPIGDILRGGFNVARTSLGHKVIGHLALPIFKNLREEELKKLQDDEDEKLLPSQEKNLLDLSQDFVKSHFTWGHLITLAGIALMSVQKFFSPAKEGREPGIFEKFFKTVGLAMTFGGSTASILGKTFELDLKAALGKDYVLAQLNQARNRDITIFKEYDQNDIAKLKKEAEELDRILVYKDGVRESILERYAREEIGGLLDGPPGTGKTAGVNCILGKWAKRLEAENYQPVIAQLNLANFDDYLKERKREKEEISEVIDKSGIGGGLGGSFTANEGLQILEMLIRNIQKLKTKVDKHNLKAGVKKQKLAIFVDEFDKVFDPATLEGCDKTRLKNLLIQLNELFIKTEILLTSNRSLEDMIKVLEEQLYIDENQRGEEVWKPMYNRFVSKNRIYVDRPSPREVAEIIAGNLLDKYDYAIDWKDFGLKGPSGIFELDRKLLADRLEQDVTSKITRKLDGRQLKYICDDISGMLLGLARILRLTQNPITDQEWSKLSTKDKIIRTSARINRQVLYSVINHKISNMKLDISEQQNYQPVSKPNSLADMISKALNHIGKGTLNIDPHLIGNVTNLIADIATNTAA